MCWSIQRVNILSPGFICPSQLNLIFCFCSSEFPVCLFPMWGEDHRPCAEGGGTVFPCSLFPLQHLFLRTWGGTFHHRRQQQPLLCPGLPQVATDCWVLNDESNKILEMFDAIFGTRHRMLVDLNSPDFCLHHSCVKGSMSCSSMCLSTNQI